MDGLKIVSPVVSSPLPTRSAVTPGVKTVSQEPALPRPSSASTYDVQAAEQARFQQVRRLSSESYVVSDKSFTIFKDASGQYITRYTSLRDGRVTYIPEPKLFESSATVSDIPTMIKIKA
jgi:hypothetical protein